MKAFLSRNFFELFELFFGVVCYFGWYLHCPAPRKIRKDRLSEYFQYFRVAKWQHIAGYVLLPLAALVFNEAVCWFPDSWLFWFWRQYLHLVLFLLLAFNYAALGEWYYYHYEAKLVGYRIVVERSSRNYLIILLCLFNVLNVFFIAYAIHCFSIGEPFFVGIW